MAYKDHFTTKFRQSDMIGALLKAANKKADLKGEKGRRLFDDDNEGCRIFPNLG